MDILRSLWITVVILVAIHDSSYGQTIPPTSFECSDVIEISEQKFYQESCQNDTDCYSSPASMVCLSGKCQCTDNNQQKDRFVGEKGIKKICVSVPSGFAECDDKCQKPFTCQLYTGEGGDGKTKICQCLAPYIVKDGTCVKDCPIGQFYNAVQDKCIPPCKTTEISINNICKPLVNLDGSCEVGQQCQVAFSDCRANVCSCDPGFSKKNGFCLPLSVNCPTGDVGKTSNGDFQRCKITYVYPDDKNRPVPLKSAGKGNIRLPPPPFLRKLPKDDCPNGYTCMPSSPSVGYLDENYGFCCPSVKQQESQCPVGNPHPSAVCQVTAQGQTYCPWDTHYCYSTPGLNLPVGGGNDNQVCCPRVCPQNLVASTDGTKCYPRVNVGDPCVLKAQCNGGDLADCVDAVCKCTNGSVRVGSALHSSCQLKCASDEVQHDNKCEKRLKLGDSCDKQAEYKCPTFAYCNKNNLCACSCGYFTLADNTCAPGPICPPPILPFPRIGLAAAQGPPPIPRISDKDRQELLKNTTFCAVTNQTAPPSVQTKSCSADQYCAPYIEKVGICCPKPKPYCFGSATPVSNKTCNPQDPLSCGIKANCIRNYSPANQDLTSNSTVGNVCCPKFAE